ncbi:MAG: hypothetical protein AAGK74_09505 [Chloroflexota bacterium]
MDKRWMFVLFALFIALPLLKVTHGFALFFLPLLFFWLMGSSRGHGHSGHGWGWHCGPDDGPDGEKRKEKPKRQYIETVDGEYFEVIEEPRKV